nr:tyrosine-type recombinase/integrase [uncultured Roseobacter sp.]
MSGRLYLFTVSAVALSNAVGLPCASLNASISEPPERTAPKFKASDAFEITGNRPAPCPHRFRHSATTLLIEEGVDIRLVQRLLGHASIAKTEIYTKGSDSSLSSAVTAADTLAKVDTY